MVQSSFKQTFVTNSSTLLASGATVENLAVGQVGILDGTTYVATETPTYAKNKALKLVWGTPDLSHLNYRSGVPNQNEYTKLIKGKALKDFKGVAAHPGQQEIVTVGWSGDAADTDTLSANPGEVKYLFLKLTGGPIDKKFSLQGVTRQYSYQAGTVDDTSVDLAKMAEDLAKQINFDSNINTFVKACAIISPDSAFGAPTDTDYKFKLVVCDTRDGKALGDVQSQYPDDVVKRIGVQGASSIYEIVRDANTTPDAFSTVDTALIPDCDECPTGYTLVDSGFAYKVVRSDAGSAGALTTVKSDYGIASGDESGSRVNYEFGSSTYIIVSDTKINSASGTDELTFLGDARASCVLTTPTEVPWEANGTLVKFEKTYKITVADDECGEDRLTDLQAAFPSLTVSLVAESSGDCVHSYETTIESAPVEDTCCSVEDLIFVKPAAFEGIEWEEVADASLDPAVKVGIRFEATYVGRVTNDATFQYFPQQEQEAVHIQASEFDPNYHSAPDFAVSSWPVKKIQGFKLAVGTGVGVRKMEKDSLSYALRERSFDPVVRELEQFEFQAKPDQFYDEYILDFDFSYKVGGWSEQYTDGYKLHVFFPQGQGKAFEAAINGYLASANINIDPVYL